METMWCLHPDERSLFSAYRHWIREHAPTWAGQGTVLMVASGLVSAFVFENWILLVIPLSVIGGLFALYSAYLLLLRIPFEMRRDLRRQLEQAHGRFVIDDRSQAIAVLRSEADRIEDAWEAFTHARNGLKGQALKDFIDCQNKLVATYRQQDASRLLATMRHFGHARGAGAFANPPQTAKTLRRVADMIEKRI